MRLPVLALHRVVAEPTAFHDVSLRSLEVLLDSLCAARTVTTDLSPFDESRTDRFVLTFDDATTDHHAVGELLAERCLAGIFFVPTGLVGSKGHLSWAAVRELVSMGHAVGCHSESHIPFDRLSPSQITQELRIPLLRMSEQGFREPLPFAAPGGVMTPRLGDFAREAGHTCCRTMRWGIYRNASQRYRVPVIPLTEPLLSRGWVARAAITGRLPSAMHLMSLGRTALPESLRQVLKARVAQQLDRRG